MSSAAKEAAKFLKSTVRLPTTKWPYRPTPSDIARYIPRCTDELYAWQKQTRPSDKKFTLHDGPPYANGDLHVGHALNKIIKDIIVRSKLAEGHQADYVPGWDCHGLPIEQKVLEHQGWKRNDTSDALKIRTAARKFAYDTVKKQMKGFRSWAVMADWDHHWKTLDQDFELRQLEVFKAMNQAGLIYRRNKPVSWSPSSRTALAEAEIEYDDNFVSTAALIKFPLHGPLSSSEPLYAVIYTTTPWTIPANQAIAINKDFEYLIVQSKLHGRLVVVSSQLPYLQKQIGETLNVVGSASVADLLASTYSNLSIFGDDGQNRPIYHANFVKGESGTGLVHCAPGHGKDDYDALQSLIKSGRVQVKAPVDDQGRYTDDAAPDDPSSLTGLYVYEGGNSKILDLLRQSGRLLTDYKITHSYPIDWRTKEPLMTRATAQWFADVSNIKEAALTSLNQVTFKPDTGRVRLSSFINNRSEWCISRQRAWGVPIPALYHRETGEAILTISSIDHIISVVRDRGTNAWWSDSDDDAAWMPDGFSSQEYRRGLDTMDVWFDSGTSWTFMQNQGNASAVADVYMEGSDQHRGWFQSSLLTSIAYQQSLASGKVPEAPFRTLVTHGFTLDSEGKKMSKSLGNTISPDEVIAGLANTTKNAPPTTSKKHKSTPPAGPDALRLWAASSDWTKDVIVSEQVVSTVHTNLEKYRNTFKLLLGMLADFDSQKLVPYNSMSQLDQLALLHLYDTSNSVRQSLSALEFHKAIAGINRWLTTDLSGFYVEAIKDTMYCGSPSDQRRQSAVSALYHIFTQFQHMLGSILPMLVEETVEFSPKGVQTANEHPLRRVWAALPVEWDNKQHRSLLPQLSKINLAVKSLQERAREENLMGSSLECEVLLCGEHDGIFLTPELESTMREILVVSKLARATLDEGLSLVTEHRERNSWALSMHLGTNTDATVVVKNTTNQKCARCWNFTVIDETQQVSMEGLPLCQRCDEVVAETMRQSSSTNHVQT